MDDVLQPIRRQLRPTWHPDLEPLDPSEERTVELPLLGLVSAGQPVLAVEERETLTVPARLVKRHAADRSFALYVRGDSMTDDGIDTGDLVVVEQRLASIQGCGV